jgi:hypothetical protein
MLGCLIISALIPLGSMSAPPPAHSRSRGVLPETETVFGKYADRVVKLQIIEKVSGAKTEMGSGFFISSDGYVMTNYHVISKIIYHPDRYRPELILKAGRPVPVSVVAVDVINDLAVVKADIASPAFFRLVPLGIGNGTRLYSLGYPLDIGLSIVEGTYNGFLAHAKYRKIHFTGSINPGMSGGPAITSDGKVVGINVATAGNQVSFLVPVQAALDLSGRKTSAADNRGDFLGHIRDQVLAHEKSYFPSGLMQGGIKVKLGKFLLPAQIEPHYNCWGDAPDSGKQPYTALAQHCSSDDYVAIAGHDTGEVVQISHRLLTSTELNRFQFFSLYTRTFGSRVGEDADEEETTRFVCKADLVTSNEITWKTNFCLRRYKKLEGIYSFVFKAATLGSNSTGLETTLSVDAVGFDKAVELSQAYLEAITWAK